MNLDKARLKVYVHYNALPQGQCKAKEDTMSGSRDKRARPDQFRVAPKAPRQPRTSGSPGRERKIGHPGGEEHNRSNQGGKGGRRW